jgi:hypothetical protein
MSESRHNKQPSREYAERVAVAALGFLGEDEERLHRFIALSGIDPADIRSSAADPAFLSGVLAHIMEDDRLAEAFASDQGLTPESLMRAAAALGGHWERDVP